jgi:hypothetical protein
VVKARTFSTVIWVLLVLLVVLAVLVLLVVLAVLVLLVVLAVLVLLVVLVLAVVVVVVLVLLVVLALESSLETVSVSPPEGDRQPQIRKAAPAPRPTWAGFLIRCIPPLSRPLADSPSQAHPGS